MDKRWEVEEREATAPTCPKTTTKEEQEEETTMTCKQWLDGADAAVAVVFAELDKRRQIQQTQGFSQQTCFGPTPHWLNTAAHHS